MRTEEKDNIVLRLTRVWLWAMLAGMPLAFHDGFFDITETKTIWFVVCAALYLLGRGVCRLQFGPSGRRRKPTAAGYCAAAFCFITLLASVGSGFLRDSLIGAQGRWQGALMLWIYAALWAVLRDVPLKKEDVTLPLAVGMAASAAIAVMNHLGLDPLRFEAPLGSFDRGRYISTLGNINFAGAYLALAVPAAARAALTAETRRGRLIWGAVSALGLWAAMAVRSESAVLGVGAGLAVLPFTLRDRAQLSRWCLLPGAAAVLMQLYRIPAALCGAGFSSLTSLLLRPWCAVALTLSGMAFLPAARRTTDAKRFHRGYGITLALLATAAVIVLVLLNTAFADVPLSGAEAWLRFSDEWGTDRVGVWKHCLALRESFGPWERILGGGCGILARLDSQDRIFPDAVLDAAHCEYLQILLNWGTAGLAAYLGWLVLSVREGFRNGGALAGALLPGLAGYAVQAAVNIAQAPGIMLFFVLLAAQRSKIRENSPDFQHIVG